LRSWNGTNLKHDNGTLSPKTMNNIEKKEMLVKKLAFIKQEIDLMSEKRLRLFEEQKQVDLKLTELIQEAKNVIDEKQELAEIIDFENFKNTGT